RWYMRMITLPRTSDRKCGVAQYSRPAADRSALVNIEGVDDDLCSARVRIRRSGHLDRQNMRSSREIRRHEQRRLIFLLHRRMRIDVDHEHAFDVHPGDSTAKATVAEPADVLSGEGEADVVAGGRRIRCELAAPELESRSGRPRSAPSRARMRFLSPRDSRQ